MLTIKVVFLVSCALLFVAATTAKPTDAYKQQFIPGQYCTDDNKKMELCQKCAKITKSDRVYPDCCKEVDGVFLWCYRYVYFGLQYATES